MVDYITIGIKTLLGKSNIIPSQLRLLSPTRYVYIRKELNNIILDNNYSKIEYDLLTNGKKMEDYKEYIGGIVMLVPKIETGYKIDKEYRKMYIPLGKIPLEKIPLEKRQLGKIVLRKRPLEKPIILNKVKRLEENIRTRCVLDMLNKKKKEKKRKRYLKRVDLNIKKNYCGFKWGFLL